MYDQIYFTKTRYDESRRLEEFGLSQPLAERLVLSYEFEEEETYTIVGSTEVDLAQNKISNESPIGKALLGAKKNQVVEVNAPAGVIKYKVLSITK